VPHLGTAYTTTAADALVRFERMDGRDAWMLTGLDEHGQKVAASAADHGVSPQEWVDGIAPKFKEAWAMLNVSYDDFIRTTEPRHAQGVQRFCEALRDNGFLYKDTYQDWYCVPEETFFTSEQLKEAGALPAEDPGTPGIAPAGATEGAEAPEAAPPLCPDCGRPLSYVSEENWFFKLSAFQQPLLDFYEANPDFICPQTRRNEVLSFVKGGLKDLSITRTTFDWGIPLPFDADHVIYVWVDALINYITAVGYGSDDPDQQAVFARRWPAQLHFVGKDIIRFHCVIWPAMLMAVGLEPPRKVFAHGFLLTKGEKMSKSRGNVMTPEELTRIFGVDAYRYYFLSDVQFGADGSISLERMAQVYNADLANSWGNLCSRVFNMTNKYLGGEVPELWAQTTAWLTRDMGNPLAEASEGLYQRFAGAMNEINYSGALGAVMELCNRANLYVEESAPWSLAKAAEAEGGAEGAADAGANGEAAAAAAAGANGDAAAAAAAPGADADAKQPTQLDRLRFVLYNSLEAIRLMALLFAPVMPATSTEVWRRLGLGDPLAVTALAEECQWGLLPAGNRIEIGSPLFPRLSDDDLNKLIAG
jgi:methionyl-tRNA synthetase